MMLRAGQTANGSGYRTLAAIVRCTAGYIAACAIAGVVQVAFVLPPLELAGADTDRQMAAAVWALLAALHSGIFGAPFALAALVLAEWRGLKVPIYYLGAGFGIATLGFLAQMPPYEFMQPVVVPLFVLAALLTAGLSAGLVYWLISGRHAGKRGVKFIATDAAPQ